MIRQMQAHGIDPGQPASIGPALRCAPSVHPVAALVSIDADATQAFADAKDGDCGRRHRFGENGRGNRAEW
jgi:hypothetical protein